MQMLTLCHKHEQLNVSPYAAGLSKPRFGNVTASRKWLRVDDTGSINYITVSCMRSNRQAWLCRHDSRVPLFMTAASSCLLWLQLAWLLTAHPSGPSQKIGTVEICLHA